VTGTILRCNTRIELTVMEFLRLDRMRDAKHAVPARLHCELEHQHDGDHVAFAQHGEGTWTTGAEWWLRWSGDRRDITELPWCLAKDPSWPEDAAEDDPMFCGLPENHEGAHEWEMRSDPVFTRTANGIGELDRDRLRAVPRDDRPQLRIHRWEMVMAVRWPDWDHWLMIWPPEYPDYERHPQAPEWKRHMTDADFDAPEWIDPAGQFRRDLPVMTGDAREQLRRAEDSLRRAFSGIGQALDAIDAHPWRR
jgi:hypothetical protein